MMIPKNVCKNTSAVVVKAAFRGHHSLDLCRSFGVHLEPFQPKQKEKVYPIYSATHCQKSDSDSQHQELFTTL